MSEGKQTKAGLYVHVPFCSKKCPYCDFYSTQEPGDVKQWLNALEKEAFFYRNCFDDFATLYVGGGTPTVLKAEDLERLVCVVNNNFSFSPDSEKTIEANPESLTKEKADKLFSLGFNRISLGVQSFDDQDLQFLGRSHTSMQAEKAMEFISLAGFKNLSIDLIYMLPGSSMEKWTRVIRHAVSFEPEHISCYQLTIKKGTPFWTLQQKGVIREVGEKEQERTFVFTSDFLRDRGYCHYEVSNFSRGEENVSIHNQNYWQHVPYLGLGPSAHSFAQSKRWWNVSSVQRYNSTLTENRRPVESMETLSCEQIEIEALFLKFRTTAGMDIKTFKNLNRADKVLPELKRSGFVEIKGGRVVPTTKGLLMADSIARIFL